MKLIDLVSYFRQGGISEDFCKSNSLDPESEVIEVYAEEPVSFESNLGFFPIEETEGQIEHQSDGKKYHNLFDFFYFLEAIEEVKNNDVQDIVLAESLFSYALNDA